MRRSFSLEIRAFEGAKAGRTACDSYRFVATEKIIGPRPGGGTVRRTMSSRSKCWRTSGGRTMRKCSGNGRPGKAAATVAVRTSVTTFRNDCDGRPMAIKTRQSHSRPPRRCPALKKPVCTRRVCAATAPSPAESIRSSDMNVFQESSPVDFIENYFNGTKSKDSKIRNLETNSEERTFKDVACDTHFLEYDCDREDVTHQVQNNMALPLNEILIIQCRVCGNFTAADDYNQHIETFEHKTAIKECFKNRIDFVNYQIFPRFSCVTVLEFFKCIEHDFFVLIDHIILTHVSVLINIEFCMLYHEESSIVENKNIAEVKHLCVPNKELSKDTDVSKLFKDIIDSIIEENDKFQNSSWSLEELISVEVIITNTLSVNGVASNLFAMSSHSDKNDITPKGSDCLEKTIPLEPLQILCCKQCQIYVVQNNYQQHVDTIGHKMSVYYFQSKNVQIRRVQCEAHILSCLIISPEHNLIDDFFHSIESHTLELIDHIIKLHVRAVIGVDIKMIALYSDSDLKAESDMLGKVKSFAIKDEILSGATSLSVWFQTVSITLRSYNEEYLKTTVQNNCYLVRPLFLDINFHEIINI